MSGDVWSMLGRCPELQTAYVVKTTRTGSPIRCMFLSTCLHIGHANYIVEGLGFNITDRAEPPNPSLSLNLQPPDEAELQHPACCGSPRQGCSTASQSLMTGIWFPSSLVFFFFLVGLSYST